MWSLLLKWPKYQGWEYLKIFLNHLFSILSLASLSAKGLSTTVLCMPWAPGWEAPAFKSHNIKQHVGGRGCAFVDGKQSRNHRGKVANILRTPRPLNSSLGSWLLKSHIYPELAGWQAPCEEIKHILTALESKVVVFYLPAASGWACSKEAPKRHSNILVLIKHLFPSVSSFTIDPIHSNLNLDHYEAVCKLFLLNVDHFVQIFGYQS